MQLPEPLVLPPEVHPLNDQAISRNAMTVLRKLQEAGHAAYLVGGGVRDVLVGEHPKDFDVATNASPEQVRAQFRNARIIGRRFRLVHVVFGRDVIEVATFRADHAKGEGGRVGESGRIVRDNVYGTIEEDAIRRDFTINALYYNIADGCVIDFVGGLADIDARVLKLIGEPERRCEEDPVRVIRAARLSAKLDFDIDKDTLSAMQTSAAQLAQVPPARLFEEMLKLFQGGYATRSFRSLRQHDLLRYLFPGLAEKLDSEESERFAGMIEFALDNTDRRVEQGKPVTPYYLLAFMLWPEVEAATLHYLAEGASVGEALHRAGGEVVQEQLPVLAIPLRLRAPMREIWEMQGTLEAARDELNLKLMSSRRFRASYDFLCLRARQNPALEALAKWWTDIQELDESARKAFLAEKPPAPACWMPRLEGETAESALHTPMAADVPEHATHFALGMAEQHQSHRQRGGRNQNGARKSSARQGSGAQPAEDSGNARNNKRRRGGKSGTRSRQRDQSPSGRSVEEAGGNRAAPFGGGGGAPGGNASPSNGDSGKTRSRRRSGRRRSSGGNGGDGNRASALPRDEHGDINGNR